MFYFLKLETNSYTSYIIAYQHKPYFTLREQQYKSSKIWLKHSQRVPTFTVSSSQVCATATDRTLTATSTDATQIITNSG